MWCATLAIAFLKLAPPAFIPKYLRYAAACEGAAGHCVTTGGKHAGYTPVYPSGHTSTSGNVQIGCTPTYPVGQVSGSGVTHVG